MGTEFIDIRIVGLDEEHTTRADPTAPLFDVHFVLSAHPPVGWAKFVRARTGPRSLAGRQGWLQSKYFVVRCAVGEVERVLAKLRPILEATNRQYRDWSAVEAGIRLEEEAFDQRELQKLRDVKARLGFD